MIENEKDGMLEYLSRMTDKENPLFKIIGYYLHDEECVEELKDYLEKRMAVAGFIIVVLMNVILLADLIYVLTSYYLWIIKLIDIFLLSYIDYVVIRKYRSFLALCYSYKVLYLRIQKIPEDVLKKTYNRIINQKI